MFDSVGTRPGNRFVRSGAGGGTGYLQTNVYFSSTTVVIPAGATKAWVRLTGSGGGAVATSVGAGGCCPTVTPGASAGGSGAYLEKFLTGLTASSTLVLTIGAVGGNTTGNAVTSGGSSTLVSGTQTISTLTAGGGGGANTPGGSGGSGGTATGGDVNISGNPGTFIGTSTTAIPLSLGNPLAPAVTIVGSRVAAVGSPFGGGGAATTGSTNIAANGGSGGCIIMWYAA